MNVLIAEETIGLSNLWSNHLERAGVNVKTASTPAKAVEQLQNSSFDALIMNLNFPEHSVLGISDLATYRNPDIAIVLVSNDSFFSDGSIFELIPNARGFFNDAVDPEDLANIVKHYAA